MCILFFKCSSDPGDNYKLILASNRDEYFERPTEPAEFWKERPDILSGLDLQPGKEGGTWLGISKNRLAVLLNFMGPVDQNAKGRGSLVSGFLKSSLKPIEYLEYIARKRQEYKSFNLIAMDLSHPSIEVGIYSSADDKDPRLLEPGVYGVANTFMEQPWKKAVHGKEKLAEIASQASTMSKQQLIEKLISLLNDDTHRPDPGIFKQAEEFRDYGPKVYDILSAINVKLPNCGTRTNTVILIDSEDQVTYVERTMVEPINAQNPQWSTQAFTFPLEKRH